MSNPQKIHRLKKLGCIGTVGLVVLYVLAPLFGRVPFEFIWLLFFGWVGFLARVWPLISFNQEIAVNAVIALGLALYGLHRTLCWWGARRESGPLTWRFGWTLKITLMVLLLFATSIAAVGIVHQAAWLCREPKLIVMIGRSAATKELSNLKQVATACRLYAIDREGKLPERLIELIPDYLPDAQLLFTQAMEGDPPQPILYFPGYKDTDDPTLLIVASPRPFASGSKRNRCIARLDTSGTVIDESTFLELIRTQGRGNPEP